MLNFNFVHLVCPVIYYWIFIDFGNILIYTFLEFLLGIDAYTTQTLFGHFAKETLDEIEP